MWVFGLISGVLLLYAAFNCLLLWTWYRLEPFRPSAKASPNIRLTVVVPIRNEAAHLPDLLQDLAAQQYPLSHYEVYLVNDASEDESEAIIKHFIAEQAHLPFHLLNLRPPYRYAPKKEAISQAISRSQADLIICTDGDCRLPPDWLALYADCYQQTGAKFISGAVCFSDTAKLRGRMQSIEFASLVGSGAVLLNLGLASMCNGANLAYERCAFEEVEGFEGVGHLASGDDEFVLHKIAQKYPKSLVFLKNKAHIVRTAAPPSLRAFYEQRRRWSSKWAHYRNWQPKVLALFIFLSNLALIALPIMAYLGAWSWGQIFLLLLLKTLPEYLFLHYFLGFLSQQNNRKLIPLVQIIYPFYVLLFGFLANSGSYYWKGRRLR